MRALEEDEVLTVDQKVLVRKRLEAWHGQDAEGVGEQHEAMGYNQG